jgi:hypothetical protein
MQILFDQGTPAPLRRSPGGHSVVTAFEKGWSDLENGDLLRAAEADGFDALVTTDQNLKHRQNLRGRKLAVLVLLTTSWPRIQHRADEVVATVNARKPGEYRELGFGN